MRRELFDLRDSRRFFSGFEIAPQGRTLGGGV